MSDLRISDKRIRCYTSGDIIKFIDVITEDDKPEFHDISESDLLDMFKGTIKELDEVDELPDSLKSSLTYEPYNEEYYRLKFSGFEDHVYGILAEVDKEANAD